MGSDKTQNRTRNGMAQPNHYCTLIVCHSLKLHPKNLDQHYYVYFDRLAYPNYMYSDRLQLTYCNCV